MYKIYIYIETTIINFLQVKFHRRIVKLKNNKLKYILGWTQSSINFHRSVRSNERLETDRPLTSWQPLRFCGQNTARDGCHRLHALSRSIAVLPVAEVEEGGKKREKKNYRYPARANRRTRNCFPGLRFARLAKINVPRWIAINSCFRVDRT